MQEKKPYLVIVLIQSIYAAYFLLSKLAFDVGMNTFVFVFYRQAIATIFLIPFAICSQRKTAPPLPFSTFVKIFFLSLFGITMSLNLANVGVKYTTASLGAATANTLPVMTFFLAVLLRMETLNIRTWSGIMKFGGVMSCLAGAGVTAFYRGPLLKLMLHHHLINIHSVSHRLPSTLTWIKGVFLLLVANFAWSCWLVLQGRVLKSYPSKLLLTTLQCMMSTIQSFIIALIFARDTSQWKLGLNLKLVSVTFCGIVVTGLTFYLQSWVVEKKGPVFLAITTPLVMLFTIIGSTFLFGEIISLGSILGALLLIGGLYFVLWGKMKEEERAKVQNVDAERGCCEQNN